jgi:predicted ester cyclase
MVDEIPLEENKLVATRFFQLLPEVTDRGNVDLLDEVLAPNVSIHGTAGEFGSLADFKSAIRQQARLLDDNAVVMHHLISEGEIVSATFTHAMTVIAEEFMGLPARGKRVAFTGTAKLRIADSKVAEMWMHEDIPALQTQLAAPDPQGASA